MRQTAITILTEQFCAEITGYNITGEDRVRTFIWDVRPDGILGDMVFESYCAMEGAEMVHYLHFETEDLEPICHKHWRDTPNEMAMKLVFAQLEWADETD